MDSRRWGGLAVGRQRSMVLTAAETTVAARRSGRRRRRRGRGQASTEMEGRRRAEAETESREGGGESRVWFMHLAPSGGWIRWAELF
jgi:hypothetical protein